MRSPRSTPGQGRGTGQLITVIAGLVIAAAGIYMVVQAFGLDFTRYLRMGWMSRRTQDTVAQLGRAGYAARGVIVFLVGVAAFDAAVTYDPARAKWRRTYGGVPV